MSEEAVRQAREWLAAEELQQSDYLGKVLAAYRRDSLIEELEGLAKEMCWTAYNCHERGIHTPACDKILRRLEQLKEEDGND